MDISPEDEAEIWALVNDELDPGAPGMPLEEFIARMKALEARGLRPRYLEVSSQVKPGGAYLSANQEWYDSPEFEQVRLRLVELSGSEETGTRLARTYTSQGVSWIFEGRPEPLDVGLVAAMIWRRRHLFESADLGDVLAWEQLKEQLEADGQ